ncbi:MAG TPA: hypothetical protein VGB48_09155 [Allosphingosinicella sp.]
MKTVSLKQALLAAAAFALLPTAASAQSDVKERAEELSDQANEMQQEAQELANDATATRAPREEDRDGVTAIDGNRADAGERDGDDDSGKWGLLGLLGLAGLLGLKRRDNNHHVHTDNRRV